MPLYRYEALNVQGKKTDGMINADCMEMAKERLKKQKVGCLVIPPSESAANFRN